MKQANQQPSASFTQLFRFATKADSILITIGVFSSIITGTAIPFFAYISGSMIDAFQQQDEIYSQAKKNLYLYALLGCAAGVMAMTSFSTWLIAGERQTIRCREKYFGSLLKQQIAWFDTQHQAEIATKFSIDALLFQLAVGQKLSTLIMLISMFVAGLAISFYQGWILSSVILAYIPFIIFCWYKDAAIIKKKNQLSDTIYLEADGKSQQSLSAIRLIKSMNAQRFELQKNTQVLQKVKKQQQEVSLSYSVWTFASILSINLGFTLSFWYGSECVFGTQKCPENLNRKAYTAGSVVKIFYSLLLPAITLNQITPCIQKISEGKSAAARIFKVIDRVPTILSKVDAIKPNSFKGVFKFQSVSFAYPKNKKAKILQNLDLLIDCQNSAIVGTSGCGKSTIFQLMMRYYDPDQGRVLLDGQDLRDLDLEWLRSNIGYIQQQPTLFAVSLRQNLLLGKEKATSQELQQVLKKSQAYEFFKQLKDGFDTFVGSDGCQLSGGQKQRVAIARSLLKKPKVLLLDEATSALDQKNEKQILKTLKKIGKEFVTISITHRMNVLADCNKIFYFANKKIKKIQNKSDYSKGYQNQIQNQSQVLKMQKKYPQQSNQRRQQNQYFQLFIRGKKQEDQRTIAHQKEPSQTQEIVKQAEKDQLAKIYSYIFKNKFLLILALVMSVLDGLTFPMLGVMLAQIVAAQLKYPTDTQYYSQRVRIYCFVCLGLSITSAILNTVMHLCMFQVSSSAVREIRELTYDKILRMPIEWFDKQENQPEKILSKISTSCKHLKDFILMFIPHICIIAANILFCVIGAIAFDWRTGLTSICLLPLILIAQTIQFHFVQGFNQSSGKAFEGASLIVSESIMSIRNVLSLDPNILLHRYQKKLSGIFAEITKKCIFSGFMYGISYLIQYITFGLIFFFSAVFVSNYNIDTANSFSAIFLIVFACASAGNNANFVGDASKAKSAANSMFSILQLEDQHQFRAKSGSKGLTSLINGNITFKNVSLKYQNRQQFALRNVSFALKAGQKIGLVGSSGCGKSSIFSLLLGFYQPNEGQILIDGISIKDYDLHHLRSVFGVVNQEPVLFNQSIAWNIKYNYTEAQTEKIYLAAGQASFDPSTRIQCIQRKNHQSQKTIENLGANANKKQLGNSISNLNNQQTNCVEFFFSRNVGPKGCHVSGGQKQRIAIVRAILRNPTILLLDEATSALDSQNEKIVQRTLDRLMQKKTTLSITHRIETVKNSDLIMVFKSGVLVEQGTYQNLLKMKDEFCKLLGEKIND